MIKGVVAIDTLFLWLSVQGPQSALIGQPSQARAETAHRVPGSAFLVFLQPQATIFLFSSLKLQAGGFVPRLQHIMRGSPLTSYFLGVGLNYHMSVITLSLVSFGCGQPLSDSSPIIQPL